MFDSPDFYFRSPEEMKGLFLPFESAIENTIKIAEKCNISIPTGSWVLPHFPLPDGKTPEEYLKLLTQERVKTRFDKKTNEISDRLAYELEIICKKGYATYFLIVQDFVNWAKSQNIMVGPGRGSVAGSLVAYVLRITDVNPLYHTIPFERFLNPQRPSPPDIDLDFADDRRDEVIQYVTDKYGQDRVAQIITFGTMEARAAVRDAGRALGMPYSAPDRIAKMIPQGNQGFPMTINNALKVSSDLSSAYSSEKDTQKLLDLAKKLEGVSRHSSVHAAGVVISDKPLTDYVPLQREPKAGNIITQYDMYSLDLNAVSDGIAVGLLKMDFLGLRNLSILEKALKFVETTQGVKLKLDQIPLTDKQTFELISKGETVGVFQLESAGMRRLGRQLKPTKFSDISAMVALYRPGPMAWINDFIGAKNDPTRIKYPHPDLKPILSPTYGIAVYQEQCMQIANKMAGFSMAEADGLRLAMGKKKKDIMEKEKKHFIEGCVKQKYSRQVAEKVFSLIEKFVGYGFNIAHSTSYGMIAYWTAYVKAHYAIEFMTALLTADTVGASGPIREEKLRIGVNECKRLDIPVLPPDVNTSQSEFTIENNKSIRFGLSAIKNVGTAAITVIIQERMKGLFTSFIDFCSRVDLSKVNKKTLESLIKVGTFDSFNNRSTLLLSYIDVLDKIQKAKKRSLENQDSLFTDFDDTPKLTLHESSELSKTELLSYEKSLLGYYLSEHPLETILKKSTFLVTHRIEELDVLDASTKIRVCGMIVRIKKVYTRNNNNEMAFVALEDLTGSTELVVFPKTYASYKKLLVKDSAIGISGVVDKKEGRITILVNAIYPLD
jgi:DNA polymerase-3 subunit alpha